jgi:hypothetical protein
MYTFLLPPKNKRHKRTNTGSSIASYPHNNKNKTHYGKYLIINKSVLDLYQSIRIISINSSSFNVLDSIAN